MNKNQAYHIVSILTVIYSSWAAAEPLLEPSLASYHTVPLVGALMAGGVGALWKAYDLRKKLNNESSVDDLTSATTAGGESLRRAIWASVGLGVGQLILGGIAYKLRSQRTAAHAAFMAFPILGAAGAAVWVAGKEWRNFLRGEMADDLVSFPRDILLYHLLVPVAAGTSLFGLTAQWNNMMRMRA